MKYSFFGAQFASENEPADVIASLRDGDTITGFFGPARINADRIAVGVNTEASNQITLGPDVRSIYLYHNAGGFEQTYRYNQLSTYLADDPGVTVTGNDLGNAVTFMNMKATFLGGTGDDTVHLSLHKAYNANDGFSALYGGPGDDLLRLDLSTATTAVAMASGDEGLSGTVKGAVATVFTYPDSYHPDRYYVSDTMTAVEIRYDSFERLEIRSGSANDTLVGGRQADALHGNGGSDNLYGAAGDDRLYGGAGPDAIIGGPGADVLHGGADGDRFFFAAGDAGKGSAERDFIADFETGVDQIDLTQMNDQAAFTIERMGDKALIRLDADLDGTYEMQIAIGFAAGSSYQGFGVGSILL